MGTDVTTTQQQRTDVAVPVGQVSALSDKVRLAKGIAESDIIPTAFRGKPSNVMIALEYSERLGASFLAVMQNLAMVNGKPSLSASFLIGTVNACKRFTPLRFEWVGTAADKATWGCRCVATDVATQERCLGALITWEMATAEGWTTKAGSKWKTMPEQMFMYRAASFWTRVYCPELSLGLHTTDEVEDYTGAGDMPQVVRAQSIASALDAGDHGEGDEDEEGIVDTSTGEVIETTDATETTEEDKRRDAAKQLFEITLGKMRPDLVGNPDALEEFLSSAIGTGEVAKFGTSEFNEATKALSKAPAAKKETTKKDPPKTGAPSATERLFGDDDA